MSKIFNNFKLKFNKIASAMIVDKRLLDFEIARTEKNILLFPLECSYEKIISDFAVDIFRKK